jgi:hypothetical protein
MIFNTNATLELTTNNPKSHVVIPASNVIALLDNNHTLTFRTRDEDYSIDITGTTAYTLISSIKHFISKDGIENINVDELLRTSIAYTQSKNQYK